MSTSGGSSSPTSKPAIIDSTENFESLPSNIKAVKAPSQPSQLEIELHVAAGHMPRRNWCRSCVAGGAVSKPHRRQPEQDKEHCVPLLAIDYFFMGQDDGKCMPNLAVVCSITRMCFSIPVLKKGADEHTVRMLQNALYKLGHHRVVFKSDQEPSIVALKHRVAKETPDREFVMEESPVGDSQSDGLVENSIREIQKQARILKLDIELHYQTKIETDHPVLAWLMTYAGQVVCRCSIGSDGRSPWELFW